MWEKIVTNLAGQLTQPQYEGWVKAIKFIEADEANIYVAVPNEYYKNWINKNLSAQINSAIQQETGKNLILNIKVQPDRYENDPAQSLTSGMVSEGDNITAPNKKDKINIPLYNKELNLKYTFDSFVVGTTNRFAYTLARAVGDNPGTKYNPFFLYGGVGLGKTHLMQAIGHQVYRKFPGSKIRYLSVEKFTNELIESIRLKRTETFRSTYRQIDLLLLDDVQFLKGKENTQEELFNTFNTLYEAGKQIVLSSDRPPKQIPGLEERLVSRFEWGMMADIKAPDLETRIAILRNKAETDKMNIPDDVLELIATAYQNNIRELEGTLNRVVAYVGITGCPMNVESVRNLIEDTSKARTLTPDKIIDQVAEDFKVTAAEIKGASKMKEIATARQIAIYLVREITRQSFPAIGDVFGKKHSTIIYAYKKVREDIDKDHSLANRVSDLIGKLT